MNSVDPPCAEDEVVDGAQWFTAAVPHRFCHPCQPPHRDLPTPARILFAPRTGIVLRLPRQRLGPSSPPVIRQRISGRSTALVFLKGTVLNVLSTRPCTECDRTCVQPGATYTVEAARRDNGDEPVLKFFGELIYDAMSGKGRNRDDATRRLADIAIVLERYAMTGYLEPERELKPLQDIYEIKAGDVRLPFYYQHRHPVTPAVRLINGFIKHWPNRHPQRLIRFAQLIYREDKAR